MKKRFFAAFLAFTLVLGLGACGAKDSDKDPETGQKPGVEDGLDQDTEDEVTDGAIDEPTDGGSQTPESDGSKPSTTPPGTKPAAPSAPKPPASASKPSLSGSMEDIIQKIYDKVGYDVSTSNTEVTGDNMQYYLGTTDIAYKKALASEPMMSSVAHSVVLVQVEEGADIASIKKKIKENVDGRKWICVGVEDENILVDNVGNYIMLVMDEDAQSFMDAFLAMGK